MRVLHFTSLCEIVQIATFNPNSSTVTVYTPECKRKYPKTWHSGVQSAIEPCKPFDREPLGGWRTQWTVGNDSRSGNLSVSRLSPGREKAGRWNALSTLCAMFDAEKDWHEHSFRSFGANSRCKKFFGQSGSRLLFSSLRVASFTWYVDNTWCLTKQITFTAANIA